MTETGSLLETAQQYVRRELQRNAVDSSHDYGHIDRVQRLSSRLARLEGTSDDDSLQAIALAAVLHDVADWKYFGCGKAGPKAVKQFLDAHVPADLELTRDVLFVVANIGFKDGLDADAGRPNAPSARALTMLRCVQDADRLDALGAIGIARCFTFGGRFDRVLHDPTVAPRSSLTREAYMDATVQQTTINHFHEKLLRLESMMNTAAGRRVASARTHTMRAFLTQFDVEWDALDVV